MGEGKTGLGAGLFRFRLSRFGLFLRGITRGFAVRSVLHAFTLTAVIGIPLCKRPIALHVDDVPHLSFTTAEDGKTSGIKRSIKLNRGQRSDSPWPCAFRVT